MLERVCSVTDVADGEAKRFELGNLAVAVVRIGDDWYAIGDRCTHQDISLAEGEVDSPTRSSSSAGSTAAASRSSTAQPHALPATKPVPVYTVKIEGDDVFVEVD